jgi:predicted DNA-binding transcriptional regulator
MLQPQQIPNLTCDRERSLPGGRRRRRRSHMPEDQGVRKVRPFDPDELDRQIIRLLRADGRRSNREIARTLDVPEATVRYRVRRLIESNILRITASVDPEHLGYGLTAVISVQVEPNRINAVAEEISAMPEVMWVAITAGAHILCSWAHSGIRKRCSLS